MNKQWFAKYFALGLVLLFSATLVGNAFAAPPQPPDLETTYQIAPATVYPRSPYQFKVKVKNVGGTTAQSFKLVVNFPLTNTSPQQYILGKLTNVSTNTGCQVVSTRIECMMGSLSVNGSKSMTFNFEFPVSTRTLEIKATSSIVSGTAETNTNNNLASYIPTFTYINNPITSGNVLVTMCTGRGLSSFYECELFLSSQQQHLFSLNSDTTVSYQNTYIGNWDQLNSPQQLHMLLTGGATTAEFNGFATSNTCFEGITTFTPTSVYNSAYKVCIQ